MTRLVLQLAKIELPTEHLRKNENREAGDGPGAVIAIKGKDRSYLHAQEGKDHDEEEEQKQQGRDRLYGIQQRGHQVRQRLPISKIQCVIVIPTLDVFLLLF